VAVRFAYVVNGREYTSDKYSFDPSSSSDSGWAYDAVAANPAAATRTCYYDAANPARAILKPGIDGSNVFMLMFLTPFNAIGLGILWLVVFGWRQEKLEITPRIHDRVRDMEAYTMSAWSPFGALIGAFTLGSFLGIFVVGFSSGFHPSLVRIGLVWGTILFLSIIVMIWTSVQRNSGKYDLVLDNNSRAVTIPAMNRRSAKETVRFADIRNIEARTNRTGSGEDEKVEHQVVLQKTDGAEFLLKQEINEARANLLATRIRE
jgi:hypothetical protein